MALTRSAIGWHAASLGAGGLAVFAAMASNKVDVYAIWNAMNKIVADVTTLLATLAPVVAIFGAAYRTWNAKQVPAAALVVDTGSTSKAETDAEHPPGNTATVATINGTAVGKIVGALLIGFLLLAGVDHASAAQQNVSPLVPAKAAAGKVLQKDAVANPLLALQTFTVTDLQAALDDAKAQVPPDQAAINCYSALIPIVQTGVANPLPKGLGGFQALQKLRDAKAAAANIQSPSGPLATLNLSCAPLVLDVQNTLIQLGIVGGGVIASGGLTLPTSLPALLQFLPIH